MDDGEKIQVPSLNTHGDIRNREELAEAVSKKVDLDALANEVGKDIGEAVFVDGEVQEVNLYHWVLDQYGYEDNYQQVSNSFTVIFATSLKPYVQYTFSGYQTLYDYKKCLLGGLKPPNLHTLQQGGLGLAKYLLWSYTEYP